MHVKLLSLPIRYVQPFRRYYNSYVKNKLQMKKPFASFKRKQWMNLNKFIKRMFWFVPFQHFLLWNFGERRPLGQKCILLILLGFNDKKVFRVLWKYLYMFEFVFSSERAFQRYLEHSINYFPLCKLCIIRKHCTLWRYSVCDYVLKQSKHWKLCIIQL